MDKNKIQIKNKHMEESRGVYTLPVLYNEQSGRNEGVCVRSELGVVVGNSLDNLSTLISVNERRLAEEKNRIRAGKMHMSAIDPSNTEYYEAIKEMYGWERGKVEAFPDFK